MDEVKYMRQMIEEERGQSMLEMALVLPLLLAVVFGIIEFGHIYSTQIAMNNLARQAVRTAVVSEVADYDDVEDDMVDIANSVGLNGATVSIPPPVGSDVTATVDYDCPLITGQVIGIGTKHLTAVATMKVE